MRRTPASCASGTNRTTAADARLVKRRIVLRRMRSAATPAASPKTRNAAVSDAPRTPICAGVAARSCTAVSGSASVVTDDPIAEMTAPTQSRSNRASRQTGRASSATELLFEQTYAFLALGELRLLVRDDGGRRLL